MDDNTNQYDYTPSAAWSIVFIVLFSLSGAVHCVQAWRARSWPVYSTLVVGALLEVLGYAGRLWSSRNVYIDTPYLMQICVLIIAPVWFSGYCYTALGQAITRLGPEYSILPPRWYFALFLFADIVSLVLQAVGGGMAASALSGQSTVRATHIMLGGIVFQVATMALFLVLGADFVARKLARRPYAFRIRQIARKGSVGAAETELELNTSAERAKPNAVAQAGQHEDDAAERRGWWLFLTAVMISSLMIVLRGLMRSAELGEGWTGYIIEHQIFQYALDGIPMVIAVAVFNVLNPLWLLPRRAHWGNR
ncbi:hypothetical protein Q5752_006912 [Cryptotrichosporon argae]